MTRRPETIAFWSGRLPHWEVVGGRYFITIHLAGAIPEQGQRRLKLLAEESQRSKPSRAPSWLQRQRAIFREIEAWLDRADRTAYLAQPDVAQMVRDAIEHRVRRLDWTMLEYVVMPNHIHLFCEIGRRGLRRTISDFKRWTGHRAAEFLHLTGSRFWQREWFDHWSRSDGEDDRIMQYIRRNPVKANLVCDSRQWPYGSWNQ